MAVVGEKDVAAFDVAMTYVGHAVQVLQPQNDGGTDSSDDILALAVAVQSAPGLDEVRHTPTLAILHHDPHLSAL